MRRLELLGIAAVLGLVAFVNGFVLGPVLRGWGVPYWLAMLGMMGWAFVAGCSIGRAMARTLEQRRKQR